MDAIDFNRKSAMIEHFFEATAIQMGEVTQFVQRKRKLTGDVMAKMLILGCLENPAATLKDLAYVCFEMGVAVSPQAIDQRMDARCTAFMHGLLKTSLSYFCESTGVPSVALSQFSMVQLLDSTQIALPPRLAGDFAGSGGSASPAALKLQVSFDYQAGQVKAIEFGAGNVPDQACRLPSQLASRGSLLLFDQGYQSLDALAEIHQQGAYFITPFNRQVSIYLDQDDTHKHDLLALCQQATDDRFERDVCIGPQRLPVRLVFQRCSPEELTQRLALAQQRQQRKGRTYQPAYLLLLEWTILVSNVPPNLLSSDQLLVTYRLRWQIELIFKLWKSQAHLDHLHNWRRERLLCQTMATLCGLLIFNWLAAPLRFLDDLELSLPKAFSVFRCFLRRHADAFYYHWQLLPALLSQLNDAWTHFAFKDRRIKQPSTFNQLQLSA